jgi:hypothetical protein
MTCYMAPVYSMRSFRDMGNPYQHAPVVSIVRTDTCMTHPTAEKIRTFPFICPSNRNNTPTPNNGTQRRRVTEPQMPTAAAARRLLCSLGDVLISLFL